MNISRGNGEPLADLEKTLVEVEQVPKVHRIERRFDRKNQAVVVICIIVSLLAVAWAGWNSIKIAKNEAQFAITREGIESLEAANQRLEERGLPQIPLPREGQSIDADALAAAAAAILKEDISNDPAFRGPQGPRGDSCDSNQVGCQGPAGKDGQNGSQGRDGLPGEPGEPGQDGEDGAPGEPGAKGDKGDKGDPGMPPCPDGYTPRWEERLDGSLALVCDPSQG